MLLKITATGVTRIKVTTKASAQSEWCNVSIFADVALQTCVLYVIRAYFKSIISHLAQ